jgi:transcriptional regulator with XRE-family HTH domain
MFGGRNVNNLSWVGILRNDTNIGKVADMKGLRQVRERAGYTQEELADSIGTSRPNVSAYESGGRTMTLKMANRVLKEIGQSDVSGEELVVANRLKAYKRARESGDVSGMFDAAKAVARIGERYTLTREGDELVDEVVDDALEYAEKVAVGFEDEAEAEDEGGDGRDFFGRRITPLDEAGDDLEEDGDEEDDGRDMYGRRI